MLVLITYDVNTEDAAGIKRLRQVAKLIKIMDDHKDSIRFYNLGNNYQNRIEHFGINPGYDPEGFLMC